MRRDGKTTHKVVLLATNIQTGGTKIYNFDGGGYSHALLVMSSTTGASQVCKFKVQDSSDGVTFADVSGGPRPELSANTTSESRTILVNLNRTRRYVRASYIFEGAGATIYSVVAILQNQAQTNGQPFTVTY
jgi:hypothetical protein